MPSLVATNLLVKVELGFGLRIVLEREVCSFMLAWW
jgi:hypothetical protein